MNVCRLLILGTLLGFYTICNGQSFGIGTDIPDPSSILDVTSTNRGILIPRISINDANNASPIASPAISLLVYNTNSLITNGKGSGYYYWTGSKWQPMLDYPIASNGLMYNSITEGIRLGGQLVANTEIKLDNFDLAFNCDKSGDFKVEANGNTKLRVFDNGKVSIGSDYYQGDFNVSGTSYFSKDIFMRDGAVNSGDILMKLTSSGDDGILEIYENNALNHKIHGNGVTVFNELGLNNSSVRFESDNRDNALTVDATDDLVRIGDNNGPLTRNGQIINDQFGIQQANIDYVADLDNGSVTGTSFGVGSVEFMADGNSEIFFSDILSPATNLVVDLGWSNNWDDVYADDYWLVSDIRAKTSVAPLSYGLKEILQMHPISYQLKSDPFQEHKIGLSAQEILPLIPEVVKTHEYKKAEDETDYKKIELNLMRMTYAQLVPVLINAVKEQQVQIDEIKLTHAQSIEELKTEVEELKKVNAEIIEKLNRVLSE